MPVYEEILTKMQNRYRELSGCEADDASDIGIRLKVLAKEVHTLYEQGEELSRQVFPQTAEGKHLDMHAQTRGLMRKPPVCATGVLRFSRETPATVDLPLEAGLLCSTRGEPRIELETLAAAVLSAGQAAVEVPARAVYGGTVGNVAAGSVCQMITPAPGISGVVNSAPFSGGVDGETDNALRERLLQSYANISNGTNAAYYYDLTMGREGVASAKVLPRRRGRGTVDVVICCAHSGAETATVSALQQDLNLQKEINVDVKVSPAVRDNVNLSLQIAVGTAYDYQVVAEQCRKQVQAYLSGLQVGESLLLAQLGSQLLKVDGVYNYHIVAPSADINPAGDHVIRPGSIALTGMAVG